MLPTDNVRDQKRILVGDICIVRFNGLLAKVDTLKEFGRVVENFFTSTSSQWITNDKELNILKGRIFTVTI